MVSDKKNGFSDKYLGSVNDDSYLRKAAIKVRIPHMTAIAAAKASAEGIAYLKKHGSSDVKSLQELHREIHDK